MAKDELFEKLREILFEQERKEVEQKIDEIRHKIDERKEFEPLVEPILNDKITYIQHNFSQLFGSQVTKSIQTQIRESQDEVVEALYPIMGKMIKKYIVKEMELLSDRIDKRFEQIFSFDSFKAKIKSWFTGKKETGLAHQTDLLEPQVEQILVVEQHSGILIGSYSKTDSIDQDMVASMLTAIKSFVGDAYDKGEQELEMIEFETFKLLIRNFKSFYIVSAVSGGLTLRYKDKLDDLILDFADKVLNNQSAENVGERALDGPIRNYFNQSKNADK